MNGFILALVLVVGQGETIASRAVEVHAGNYGGSGTLLGAEGGKGLVLTAYHVLERGGRMSVEWQGRTYPAKYLAKSNEGDAAALEIACQDVPMLQLADSQPQDAILLGYGSNETLHSHSGRFAGMSRRTVDPTPDATYTYQSENGDSGGGVFSRDGRFAGIHWGSLSGRSWVVSTAKIHAFLGAKVQQTAAGKKTVVIFPFFWKSVRWSDGNNQIASCPTCPVQPSQPIALPPIQPAQPSQPIAQPPTVVQGPPGPPGPQGPPGISPDLTALTKAVAANAQAIAVLTQEVAALKAQPAAQPLPFMFRRILPGGQVTESQNLLQTDPATGKQFYSLQLEGVQGPGQTVPVTPVPQPK